MPILRRRQHHPPRHPGPLPLLVVAALASLSPALLPSWAGEPGGTLESSADGTVQRPFVDTLEVRLVQVEAVVTGQDGERVHGLQPDDFRLLVDGEATPLEVFEEVRHGITVTEGSRTALAEGEAPPEKRRGRNILVFVDDYFTERGTRNRLLGNLAKNLDTLEPGDRMAVVRFAGWGLEIRSEWTSSRDDLERVIAELRRETPSELVRKTDLASGRDPNFAVVDPKLTDVRAARQILAVTGAMAAAMRAFSDAPGRRLLVPVSTGWGFDPLRAVGNINALNTAESTRDANNYGAPAPGLGTLNASGAGTPAGRGRGARAAELMDVYGDHLLSPLTDTANLLGFTVYPLHLGRSTTAELLRTSLWLVAKETGGRIATEGGAATAPLEPVVADTGSYYVLGFAPKRAYDDRRHTVEVTVRRPQGAEVRHRRSFLDLSHKTRNRLKVEEALLLGREGGDLDVSLGEPQPARGRAVRVPVTVRIPMDWVTLLPQGEDGEQVAGDLELRVAALDGEGRRSETTVVPVRLSGPEPAPGSVATYQTAVELRDRGDQRLVLFLYDRLSGDSMARVIEPAL